MIAKIVKMHKKLQKVQKYWVKCNNNCKNICQSAKVLNDDTQYLDVDVGDDDGDDDDADIGDFEDATRRVDLD